MVIKNAVLGNGCSMMCNNHDSGNVLVGGIPENKCEQRRGTLWNGIAVKHNEMYGYLPTHSRTRHTFKGWFSEDGVTIVDGTLVRTARNHTHAEWAEIASEKVKNIFVPSNVIRKDVEGVHQRQTHIRSSHSPSSRCP